MSKLIKSLLPVFMNTAVSMAKSAIEHAAKKGNNGYLYNLNTIIDGLLEVYKQKKPIQEAFKSPQSFRALCFLALGVADDYLNSSYAVNMPNEKKAMLLSTLAMLRNFLNFKDHE